MKLSHLILRNFRSFKNETRIKVNDLNVLIGKNDIGKSSILEALDIFFNGKPDKNDLSVGSDNQRIEITCVFDDLPDNLILDDSVETSLENEFLINSEQKLEINKVFSVSNSGVITEESSIICEYPDNPQLADLLSKKRTTLRLDFEKLEINPDGVNRNQSKEIRNAIRNFYYPDGNITTATKSIKIDGRLDNEDNRKKIWTSLKKYLPLYSLFFVDKPLNDQDADIQDPMKEIVKEVLKRDTIVPLLDKLKEEVKVASTSMADETIEKLNELDSELAETLRSEFPKEPSWNTIFKLTLEDNRGVPLNKRGSGMRRLVLLSFFRAQVEKRQTEIAPNIIYALEEPETSQHPDFQLMIVHALKELSETENAQVLFTTHNSNLAKEIPKNSLRYIFRNDRNNLIVENGTNNDGTDNTAIIDRIVETLGALPNPKNKVKVLVFLEGEKDVNALINWSKLLHSHNPAVINLEQNESVAFIPTGGSQLKYYVEKKYLDGLLQSQVHIYDSDIQKYIDAVSEINAEGNPNKIGFNTTRPEMENFLHHEAINECYSDFNIAINLMEILDTDDVPLKTARAVYEIDTSRDCNNIDADAVKNLEKQKSKISKAKHHLNNSAISKMTIERLNERNGYQELKTWLDKIKEYVEA